MIKKNLLISYLVAFNTILSFSLVAHFLPIYLNELGISLVNIGAIFAFAVIIAGILRFPIGTITDKLGRKPLLLFGAIGYPLFGIGMALSQTTQQFIAIKVVVEIFIAIFWTAFWAYLYDLITRGREGKEISYSSISKEIAVIISPIIGSLVINYYGYLNLFYLAAVIGTLNIAFISVIIKEKPKKHQTIKEIEKEMSIRYKHIINIKKFRVLLLIGILHNIIWVVWYVYMPIYLSNQGMNIVKIGLILTCLHIAAMTINYPLGKLIDKTSSKYIIIPGFLLVALSGYFFLIARSYVQLILSRSAMAIGYNMDWKPITARLSHLTGNKEHGSVNGLFSAGTSITKGTVTIVAGYIATVFGIKTLLTGATTFALISGVLLMFFKTGIMAKGRSLLAKHHVMHLHSTHHHEHEGLR